MNLMDMLRRAIDLHQSGRLGEASVIYQKILEDDPTNADALHLSGVLALQNGDGERSIELIGRAVSLQPSDGRYHANLGRAYVAMDNPLSAIECYRQAIKLSPEDGDVHSDLGVALFDQGDKAGGEVSFQEALKINPESVEAHFHLALILHDCGDVSVAKVHYQQTLSLDPTRIEAWCNLGNIERELANFEAAEACYRRALELDNSVAEVHGNLGVALQETGQIEAAIASYRRAIQLNPEDAETRRNLSMALLLVGEYAEGWQEYEWRWNTHYFAPQVRSLKAPRWAGKNLTGKTILVTAEQGYGDTLQFIRFLPMIVEKGGHIIFECQAPLVDLVRGMEGGFQVIRQGEGLPDHDYQIPLLSLPGLFEVRENSIPASVPYLHAPVGPGCDFTETGFKVGLAWRGSPGFKRDGLRSPGLEPFIPLINLDGVQIYSLQKDEGLEELEKYGLKDQVIDIGSKIETFSDTAAALSQMNLIISSDTAVAHLAGAMGLPVWVALSKIPDWRWLMKGVKCPWYPTMKLYRQTSPGNWSDVVEMMCNDLPRFRTMSL